MSAAIVTRMLIIASRRRVSLATDGYPLSGEEKNVTLSARNGQSDSFFPALDLDFRQRTQSIILDDKAGSCPIQPFRLPRMPTPWVSVSVTGCHPSQEATAGIMRFTFLSWTFPIKLRSRVSQSSAPAKLAEAFPLSAFPLSAFAIDRGKVIDRHLGIRTHASASLKVGYRLVDQAAVRTGNGGEWLPAFPSDRLSRLTPLPFRITISLVGARVRRLPPAAGLRDRLVRQ